MIGDTTQKKLLQKTLDTTASNSKITNENANEKTMISSITLLNTSTTDRIISIYAYGTATTNEVIRIPLKASGTEIINQLDYILSDSESFYFKQDSGNDVNIAVMGISEEVA
jgi:hypothetical protein